jgi:hypothetical protein
MDGAQLPPALGVFGCMGQQFFSFFQKEINILCGIRVRFLQFLFFWLTHE